MAVLTNEQFAGVGVVGAIGLVGLWYLSRKTGAVVEDAIDSINPLSEENVFAKGVDGLGSVVTGQDHWNLGGAIYDGVDNIYGWFGESDEDKRKREEARLKAELLANERLDFASKFKGLNQF